MLALALWLLHHTIHSTDADILHALRHCTKGAALLAVLLYGAALALGAWRWQKLLEVQGLSFPFRTALQLTLVGGFFSLLIPGAVSGDLLKIAIATRHHPGKAPELAMVALLDRLIGMAGLFLAAFLSTLLCLPALRHCLDVSHAPAALPIVIGLLLVNAGCLGTFGAALLFFTRPRWEKRPFFQWVRRACARHFTGCLGGLLRKLNGSLELYRFQRKALFSALLLSLAIHFLCAIVIFSLGKSLHEQRMTPAQYALSTQLSNIGGALPVASGGVGVRDAIGARLYQLFGATPPEIRGVLPVFYTFVLVFWALVGAFVHSFSPTLKQIPKRL